MIPKHGVATEWGGDLTEAFGKRVDVEGLHDHKIAAEEHNVRFGAIQRIACRSPQIRVCGRARVEVGGEGDPERRYVGRPAHWQDGVLRHLHFPWGAEQSAWPAITPDERLYPLGGSSSRGDPKSAHTSTYMLKAGHREWACTPLLNPHTSPSM
jgi:hypothetical protein